MKNKISIYILLAAMTACSAGSDKNNYNARLDFSGKMGHFNIKNFEFVYVNEVKYEDLFPNGSLSSWGTSPGTRAMIKNIMSDKGFIILAENSNIPDGRAIHITCNETFKGQSDVHYKIECIFSAGRYNNKNVLFANIGRAEYQGNPLIPVTKYSETRFAAVKAALNVIIDGFFERPVPIQILVSATGLSDGNKGRAEDYRIAVIDAKLNAISQGGESISSVTFMKSYLSKESYEEELYQMVESKTKAIIKPGYVIKDLGYQHDGTYAVSIICQIEINPYLEENDSSARVIINDYLRKKGR